MNKPSSFACLCLLVLCCHMAVAQVVLPSKGSNTEMLSLNGLWKFKYIPSSAIGTDTSFSNPATSVAAWATIITPGHWELQGFAEPFYGKNLKEGTGLYRTDFKVPSGWKSQPIYLAFDGVQYGYQLWVNGQYVGSFASSFNRKVFDISKFALPGKNNVLAVKVTTRSKGWEFDTNDCWSLSGIIRDVNLFSLPATHIRDMVVKTYVRTTNATITVRALIEKVAGSKPLKDVGVVASLLDADGKLVREFPLTSKRWRASSDTASFAELLKLDNPHLWTAETPYLYTLRITLKSGKTILHNYSEHIGIREVSCTDGILKLNGQPIKLRGVDHHDLSPVNGRSVTEAEMKQDLELIRKANVNFIRTSHYQPHPRLIELCDSMGLYVMEEVPFGFGDEHLNDTSYLPILKERARATLWRDKNHPSIIVWSVGNENPLTKICLQTGRYVKALDNTRPYCFPQVGSYFKKLSETFPDSIDILAPHYPVPSVLREYAGKFNRPMIVTEYAHALGLDFDRMEALWEIMVANPKLAGGAVWHFFDQGLLRKSTQKMTADAFTTSVWLDSTTVYDNHGNEGADGLVYANRVPQVDYWQARKVYTPVKALDDTLVVTPGAQTVAIKLINRYDFTNLSETQCIWQLFADTVVVATETLALAAAPHDTTTLGIAINLPINLSASYYYLKLSFINKQNYLFYERTYPLHIASQSPNFASKLAGYVSKPMLNNTSIAFGNDNLTLNNQTGMIQVADRAGSPILVNGPYMRMGRKTTMSEQATTEKSTAATNPVWRPHLLTEPIVKTESITSSRMVVNYIYERENPAGQFITGTVEYNVTDSGRIDIHYQFAPTNAKGIALEAGLSFLLPASFTEFRWAGKGPYPAYPGKDRLDEFGLFHLNSADINFQGNRQDVDIAIFSDALGNGFALLANHANIAVERSARGIIISHNALVSGRFNKGSMPEQKIKIDDLKDITGSFSIVPLHPQWPETLLRLFGKPTQTVIPLKPFFNSYDQ